MNILADWMALIRNVSVVWGQDGYDAVNNNLVVLAASSHELNNISTSQVCDVIDDAFNHYLIQRPDTLTEAHWFYVWHDEMSSTLRICMVMGDGIDALPFCCEICPIEHLDAIVKCFLDDLYLSGIPLCDVDVVEFHEVAAYAFDDKSLNVFVKQLV